MNLTNIWPLFLGLLLVVPLVISYFRKQYSFPNIDDIKNESPWYFKVPTFLMLFSALVLLIGTTNPYLSLTKQKEEKLRTSTVLAMDLSASMNIGKIKRVKQAMKKFIDGMSESLTAHSAGLVVFSQKAYVLCPPTEDFEILHKFLGTISTETLGNTTAIGKGLLMSIHSLLGEKPSLDTLRASLEENIKLPKTKGNAVVLFSDGQHNEGVKPEKIIILAKQLNITIFIIGTGDFRASSELKAKVEKTGGKLYSVQNLKNLDKIYKSIASMQKKKVTTVSYEKKRSLALRFAKLGFLFFVTGTVIRECFLLRI